MSSGPQPTRFRHSPKGQTSGGPLTETPKGSPHNNGNMPVNSKAGQRAFMMKWLEPPVQNRPSFEEAGLVRHGVLEHMVALGSRPKSNAAAAAIAALSSSEVLSPNEEEAMLSMNSHLPVADGDGGGEEIENGGGTIDTKESVSVGDAPDASHRRRAIPRTSQHVRGGDPVTSQTTPEKPSRQSIDFGTPTISYRGQKNSRTLTPTRDTLSVSGLPPDAHDPDTPTSTLSSRRLSPSRFGHRAASSRAISSEKGLSLSHISKFTDQEAFVSTTRPSRKSLSRTLSSGTPVQTRASISPLPATSRSRRRSTRSSTRTRTASPEATTVHPEAPPLPPTRSHQDLERSGFLDAAIMDIFTQAYAKIAVDDDLNTYLADTFEVATKSYLDRGYIECAYIIKALWHHYGSNNGFLRAYAAVMTATATPKVYDTIYGLWEGKKEEGLVNDTARKHFEEGLPLPPKSPLPDHIQQLFVDTYPPPPQENAGRRASRRSSRKATSSALVREDSSSGPSRASGEQSAATAPAITNTSGGAMETDVASITTTISTPTKKSHLVANTIEADKMDTSEDSNQSAVDSRPNLDPAPFTRPRRDSTDSDSSLSPPVSIKSLDDSGEPSANDSAPSPNRATILQPAKAQKAPPTRVPRTTAKTTAAPSFMAAESAASVPIAATTPSSARPSPIVGSGAFPPPQRTATTASKGGKKAPAKKEREVDQYAVLIEQKKRDARERTVTLTPQQLSAVRPGALGAPEEVPDMQHRPTTPPPNRSGRVPRAAAVAASHTISTTAAATQAAVAAMAAVRPSRTGGKRPHEEVDDAPSAEANAEGSRDVRAETPVVRPTKKQRTGSGLRVKNSPVKKGSSAGMPRPSRAPPQPTGPLDNDEYCSACGNSGEVVCCDSCPRSYHFECVDMLKEDGLPDEWFCHMCELAHRGPQQTVKGPMAPLLEGLARNPPSAFSLPASIQNYFEGVKASAGGDYEDIVLNAPPKPSAKRKASPEPPTNFFPLVNAAGNAVLCHCCHKNSEATTADSSARPMISCSVCSAPWHLDCLSPPLAVPPVVKTWRCPLHADDDVLESSFLYPAHRNRQVKGAPNITTFYSRGMRNNGVINVTDDLKGPRDGEPRLSGSRYRLGKKRTAAQAFVGHDLERLATTYPNPDTFGRTHNLKASAIALDMFEKLRKVTGRDVDVTDARADHQRRIEEFAKQRNSEVAAMIALLDLSTTHADPVGVDVNDATAEQLLEMRARAQATMDRIATRLGEIKDTKDGDVDMVGGAE